MKKLKLQPIEVLEIIRATANLIEWGGFAEFSAAYSIKEKTVISLWEKIKIIILNEDFYLKKESYFVDVSVDEYQCIEILFSFHSKLGIQVGDCVIEK